MSRNDRYNVIPAVGSCSLTLILPICIAGELAIHNGDILICEVIGHRLIVEKYRAPVTRQTPLRMEDDSADNKNRFEIRSIKVAKNRIGSLQCAEAGHHCACCNDWNNNHNGM